MVQYEMHPQSKYFSDYCGHCKGRIRMGRKFVLDPVNRLNGRPVVFHAGCWDQAQKKKKQ